VNNTLQRLNARHNALLSDLERLSSRNRDLTQVLLQEQPFLEVDFDSDLSDHSFDPDGNSSSDSSYIRTNTRISSTEAALEDLFYLGQGPQTDIPMINRTGVMETRRRRNNSRQQISSSGTNSPTEPQPQLRPQRGQQGRDAVFAAAPALGHASQGGARAVRPGRGRGQGGRRIRPGRRSFATDFALSTPPGLRSYEDSFWSAVGANYHHHQTRGRGRGRNIRAGRARGAGRSLNADGLFGAMLMFRDFNDNDFELLTRLSEMHQPSRGLSQSSIQQMPVSKVTSSQDLGNCSICLCQMEEGQEVMRLLCLHVFHSECITPWLEKNTTCPIDKEDMEKMLHQQS